MDVLVIVLIFAAAVLVIVTVVKSVCLVPQARARNIERLGKFRRTLGPGLHPLLAFADKLRPMIDMRERVVPVREPVITSDNVDATIDMVLFYRVFDEPGVPDRRNGPYLAQYAVQNYAHAIEKLTGTELRNMVAKLSLDDLLVSRHQINHDLSVDLNGNVAKWGLAVTRVEIMTIGLPDAIEDAMEDKRGAILRADGEARAIETVVSAINRERGLYPNLLTYQYLRGILAARRADSGSDEAHRESHPAGSQHS